jgi:glutamine synthetase
MDGIENDYELMPQVVGDPHADEQWERLPVTIDGAIENFDTPFTRSTFGDVFVDNFLIMQRREAAEFAEHGHSVDGDVSDWEIARYRGVI